MKFKLFIIIIMIAMSSSYLLINSAVPESERSAEAISRVNPQLDTELKKQGLKRGSAVYLRIFKKDMILEMWIKKADRFILFKKYDICTYGLKGLGPKLLEGDKRAPEGFYTVAPIQMNPNSKFHLSFNIGYPNEYDAANGRTGSALMVHGDCVSWGCYAMTNSKIEEIYSLCDAALRAGQETFQIDIFPFRMNETNMKAHSGSKWYSFWRNLKQGYDLFEENGHIPPKVRVESKKYVFN
ncbi:MAG: murein L,D-transpeptidase [Candidatus Kapabacteria bacterium]|jgi:murein L,D-transpeptidase YafK|nr:murein L,D-transpeptidase [Candidatus Kapabacteria bacterium]